MIVYERCMPRQGARSRDLAGLMAIQEDNYIRLRQLLPDLDTPGDTALSRAAGALDLHLRMLERSRYTTTLNLTYHLEDGIGRFAAPDLRIRIYHDARLAEVLSCGRRRGVRGADYDRTRRNHSLSRTWEINRFLQKWLGYCFRQGHRFG